MAEAYSDKIIAPGLSYGGLRAYVSTSVSNVDGMTSAVSLGGRVEAIQIDDWGFTYGGWIDGVNATGDQSGRAYNATSSWATAATISASRNVTKGYSARTIEIFTWCRYSDGTTAYAKVNETIPARDSHTVSYNANGGSGAPANQTKWYGDILTLSSTKPTWSGHTFLGWATSASGGVSYNAGGQYGLDQNITLYAVWKVNATATIVYNANGGSGAPGNQTVLPSSTVILSTTIPKKTDCAFLGWSTNSSATSPTYYSGSVYTVGAISSDTTITLYAVWHKIPVYVYVNITDGKEYNGLYVYLSSGNYNGLYVSTG